MAFNQLVDAAIVGAINTVLWVLIVARLFERRRKLPAAAVSTDSITAPRADAVMLFVSVSLAFYYLVFAAWLIGPQFSGPYLFDPAPWSAVVGIIVAVASLALVTWAYRVFGSWRLLAQIDADHELITEGPFTLIRHPIYTRKPYWQLPGGIVNSDESPFDAASRAVHRELGLQLTIGRLLAVDWVPPSPGRIEGLLFVYDGASMSTEQSESIVLPREELRDWAWCTDSELAERLPAHMLRRTRAATRARAAGATCYLEDGAPRD